ncbi:MAG: hypothetical protein A4E57_02581 [Syntrophorhabdaceae bacterium PtaU1.Bin034]|nr:MAG: hypothetical protein A4E57_02581 [Syntrophorhabdaceae bacterium PtaU1.Bin034]
MKSLDDLLYRNPRWERTIEEIEQTIPLESRLSVTICHRAEIIGNKYTNNVRVVQLRNRFQCLSHWGYTVLSDPLDAIRFMETLNSFTGNLLDTDGTYQVGGAELSIVRLGKNHLFWIEFAGHDGQIQLDKRSCRIVASILGRVIATCDFL